EQEARAASVLNHPNIITVHEIGESEGRRFIVTEFVEGRTLRERLGEGRFDVGDALDICAQVAGALAKAHDAGIVHRDIKPENVMVDEEGHVKVLDFGIAKRLAPAPSIDTEAPTSAQVNTAAGVVLGTSTYMSPEQVRGLELDARTDIWSLGVVLYEMVAGRAPFEAQTYGDLLAARARPGGLSGLGLRAAGDERLDFDAERRIARARLVEVGRPLGGRSLNRRLEDSADLFTSLRRHRPCPTRRVVVSSKSLGLRESGQLQSPCGPRTSAGQARRRSAHCNTQTRRAAQQSRMEKCLQRAASRASLLATSRRLD
ncbi:MAG: hypothetical protein DMF66_18120, partial [Acidobacteria bacterium]